MKRIITLTAIAVLLAVASATAQQIAVVSEGGETTVYQTLQAAIEGASEGSVIYLPGGGFSLPDSVKISKRLAIIGIGHKSNNDNVDGITTISGNLWFNQGSSGSAVMGCYITGDINIGSDGAAVNYILIKYCNLNSAQIYNSTCQEMVVNQNIIRNMSAFGNSNSKISHNIIHSVWDVDGGFISYNILRDYGCRGSGYFSYRCITANNSIINDNIIIPYQSNGGGNWDMYVYEGTNNYINNNMSKMNFGENPINIGSESWENVFVQNGTDFHFKEAYQQYEGQVGVYADGVDFDKQMAPVPYIVAKRIAEETDAAGQLKIQVRVKAGD